jgi:hypothetical protein
VYACYYTVNQEWEWRGLTLEELLTGVLLEKGLVLHWAVEVVDHKQQDWLDLLLGVAGVVG